jgi:transcriptional antiterminator NusG
MTAIKDSSWQDLVDPNRLKRSADNWAPPVDESGAWYLMQVFTGQERHIVEYLGRNRYGGYFPMVRVLRPVPKNKLSTKQRRAGGAVLRPKIEGWLPGYLFVHFDDHDDSWHDIFGLASVRGLQCEDGTQQPFAFDRATIERWRTQEIDGVIPGEIPIRKLIEFKIGEEVRLTDGAFVGLPAVIEALPKGYDTTLEEIDEGKKATLLINVFGRPTKAKVSFGEFEKV